MSTTTAPVGTTPAAITGIPPDVDSVQVLNSSEGLGDAAGVDIVVNNSGGCSLDPQTGIRLKPGEFFVFSLRQPSNGRPLPLYAVAAGPGGQLTITIVSQE